MTQLELMEVRPRMLKLREQLWKMADHVILGGDYSPEFG